MTRERLAQNGLLPPEQRMPFVKGAYVQRAGELPYFREFLGNLGVADRPKVAMIKGLWGTGKTWLANGLYYYLETQECRAGERPLSPVLIQERGGENIVYGDFFGNYTDDTLDFVYDKNGPGNVEALKASILAGLRVQDFDLLDSDTNYVVILDGQIEQWRAWNREHGIIDHDDEREKVSLVSLMERGVLSPLIGHPNVALVMTCTGRLPSWESPILRLQTFGKKDRGETIDPLRPFTPEETRRQIELQEVMYGGVNRAIDPTKIHLYTGGHPLSNALAAESENLNKGIEQAYETVLGSVGGSVSERSGYLAALAVLEGFGESEMDVMMQNWQRLAGNDNYHPTKSEIRSVRDALLGAYCIGWNNGRFEMREPLKTLARSNLLLNKREKWIALNEKAAQLYQGWANMFPDHKDKFLEQQSYHMKQVDESYEAT